MHKEIICRQFKYTVTMTTNVEMRLPSEQTYQGMVIYINIFTSRHAGILDSDWSGADLPRGNVNLYGKIHGRSLQCQWKFL